MCNLRQHLQIDQHMQHSVSTHALLTHTAVISTMVRSGNLSVVFFCMEALSSLIFLYLVVTVCSRRVVKLMKTFS